MTFRNTLFTLAIVACVFASAGRAHADSDLLTPQENLWLQSRNNTIIVYPEKNNPPFTYQSPSGVIEGLSIDYIELIAEKVGATVQYLTPRSRSQILDEARTGKGDVILALSSSFDREQTFIFTESYVTVPYVIVVRKDASVRSSATFADYTGKRIAVTEGSAIEDYVRQNYSRVIIEDVSDDETALQHVLLGQAEAAAMDVASLSYLLSKQVLSSVKVVGTVGYDYTPSFAMTKDKQMLQTILEKGLTQISTEERKQLAEKWIALPTEEKKPTLTSILQSSTGVVVLYVLFLIVLVSLILLLVRKRRPKWNEFKKNAVVQELHEELHELEEANMALTHEIEEVKHLEEDIEEKLKRLNE